MKLFYMTWAMIAVFISGFFAGYIYTDMMKSRIAVVDINRVVAGSAQVQNLKAQQEIQNSEMNQWLQDAQKAINAEKDKEKQTEILQKYAAEFESKRNLNAQRYVAALQSIEQSINQTIQDEAKKQGYKFIITKGMILGGGDDITDDIVKVVK